MEIKHSQMCLRCGKKIRSFKKNFDWRRRKYHLSCYKDHLKYWELEKLLSGLVGKSPAHEIKE